ncbi:MAG: hypothetical protein GY797_31695 [Deltaproteobacteria bacterium]|nr:hypothetical protein [Deltaproteobacteria bacterium]
MGTMPPKELLTLWARDDMPIEMAVGHMLQNLAKLQASVEANHLKIRQLQTILESLIGKDRATQKITRHKKSSKN